ncbi:DNA repair protein RecO [Desulfurobacterium sp.]
MIETNGIIIRRKKLSSRLIHVTAYTEKLGKIDALATVDLKVFPVKLEPFSVSRLKLKISGEKMEVTEATLIKANLPESINRFKYMNNIARYLINFTGSVPDERIFNLTVFYTNIKRNFITATTMFLVKLTYFEGLFPIIDRCVMCGTRKISGFSVEEGGTLCPKCAAGKPLLYWNRKLTVKTLEFLKKSFYSIKREKTDNITAIKNAFEKHLSYRNGAGNDRETFRRQT